MGWGRSVGHSSARLDIQVLWPKVLIENPQQDAWLQPSPALPEHVLFSTSPLLSLFKPSLPSGPCTSSLLQEAPLILLLKVPDPPPSSSLSPCYTGPGAALPLVQLKMLWHLEQAPVPFWASVESRSRADSEAQLAGAHCTSYCDVL